jgi:adenosylcobinamide-GDP ribazoletransferase
MAGRGEAQHGAGWRPHVEAGLTHTAQALRFYSRLPVPALPWETDPHALPDFRTLSRALPLAGLVIGLVPAFVLALSLWLDLGAWLSAALAVAALTLATGAFHEDGLADTADGFGGGATRERRLVIMKDSLIGSFGGSALVLGFALRIGALATAASRLDAAPAAASLLIAAVVSRCAGLIVLTLLPPARLEGASFAVGQPNRADLHVAWAGAVGIALALGLAASLPLAGIALMILLPVAVALGITRVSDRLIGGQTGDVAGAIQQLAEVAALIGLLTVLKP